MVFCRKTGGVMKNAPKKKTLNLKVRTLEKKTAPKMADSMRGGNPVIGYT
jgi:hypothetical protein